MMFNSIGHRTVLAKSGTLYPAARYTLYWNTRYCVSQNCNGFLFAENLTSGVLYIVG